MNKPLPIAFILLIAGIVFARHIPVLCSIFIVTIALLLILFLIFAKKVKNLFYIISCILVFVLGAATYLNFNNLESNHISTLLQEMEKEYYIQATIISDPEYLWRKWNTRKASFLVRAESYKNGNNWIKLSGISKVEIKNSKEFYSYGDKLIFSGSLDFPPKAKNPDEFDYAQYLKNKRIYTIINIKSDDDIIITKKYKPHILRRLIFSTRRRTEFLIKRYLPYPDNALLNAMLIGKRRLVPNDLRELFIKTGTAHILSISGLHIAIISAILFFILRVLKVPRKLSSVLIIGFLIFYMSLAGAKTPIIRAVIMISMYLLGYILEREFDIYSALALAGILILINNPMHLFTVGFILSFSCVFSIVYLTPKLENITGISNKNNPVVYFFIQLLFASIAVYVGVMPIIAYYFNIISPVTIIANLFIVPLLGVILSAGILFVALAAVSNFLGLFLSPFLHLIFLIFLSIVKFFSKIPFGYFYISDIPLYAVIIYYILILTTINLKNIKFFKHNIL